MLKKVIYYPDTRGQIPALEFLLGLSRDEQQKAFAYVSYLEERGEGLRRPVAEYLGNKIYELRPKQIRMLYFFMLKDCIVLVHAFRKKTNAVPIREIKIARSRMEDFVRRYEAGLIQLGGF